MNDNRKYQYAKNSISKREEYNCILKWIPSESNIVDLGCGDGTLLAFLKERGIKGEGIDISPSGVLATKAKNIKAVVGRIDESLPYRNSSFDFAICNVTIQMVMYPEVLLREMSRISRYQIVSFPNFASLPNRLDLLVRGRMPKIMIPGYEWYSTGHIHQLSILDFESLCTLLNLRIVKRYFIFSKRMFFIPKKFLRFFPNLFAFTAIYMTESKE